MDHTKLISIKNSFLEYIRANKHASENTLKSYSSDLDQFIHFYLSIWPNRKSIEISQILERFANILNTSNKSLSSIARKISCLNSFKKFLIKQGMQINVNLKRPFIKHKEPESLTIEQTLQLLELVNFTELPTKYPLRDRAIIELLYATGILCSEIVQIELENIDFKNKCIVIRSKTKKERTVFFGKKAFVILKDYLENERVTVKSTHEKVFLNHREGPLTVRSIQRICKMFKQYLEKKQDLTPQKFRHSFATHMVANGLDMDTLQSLMGYKTKISGEKYLKLLNKNLKNA